MFQTILLPVDGSPLSFKPVDAAIEQAKMHRGRLVVLSVAEPRLFRSTEIDHAADGDAVEQSNLHEAKSTVQSVMEAARASNVACEAVVSQAYEPSDEILETAERFQCDIIFMATRGKMGVIDTVFNESVTQNVIRQSAVPVLVFP